MQCVEIQSKNFQEIELNQDHRCSICLESPDENSSKNLWFYHDDENGKRHPMHRHGCIDWSVSTGRCATCLAKIDLSSIMSLKEKRINLTWQIATDSILNSVKFFVPALIASKVMDVACNFFINSSSCAIGSPILGLSTGFFGTANLLYLQSRDNSSNPVKILSRTLGAYATSILFDLATASDDSYAFYGACVIPWVLSMGYLGYHKVQRYFRQP